MKKYVLVLPLLVSPLLAADISEQQQQRLPITINVHFDTGNHMNDTKHIAATATDQKQSIDKTPADLEQKPKSTSWITHNHMYKLLGAGLALAAIGIFRL